MNTSPHRPRRAPLCNYGRLDGKWRPVNRCSSCLLVELPESTPGNLRKAWTPGGWISNAIVPCWTGPCEPCSIHARRCVNPSDCCEMATAPITRRGKSLPQDHQSTGRYLYHPRPFCGCGSRRLDWKKTGCIFHPVTRRGSYRRLMSLLID